MRYKRCYAAGYGKGYGPILPANENGAITAGGWYASILDMIDSRIMRLFASG